MGRMEEVVRRDEEVEDYVEEEEYEREEVVIMGLA